MSRDSGFSSGYSKSTVNSSQNTTKLTPMDVGAEINRGISFKRFLMHSNNIKNEELSRKISLARQWLSDASVRSKLDDFTFKTKTQDRLVAHSFVDFGNAVLEAAMKDYDIPEERQIKLLHTSSIKSDDLPPDIAIVHVSVDDEDVVQRGRVDWRRILGTIQVWVLKSTSSKKRANIRTDTTNEGPPSKRSRSPTAADAAPSTHLSQPPNPSSSTSSHLTVPGADSPCSTSCGSSESTLYEESAEGELVDTFSSMFGARGDRTHVMGACLYGTLAKLMFASHTGIIESNEIDLAEEPELFAIFLSSFMTLSFPGIGFNSKTGFCNPCNVDDTATRCLGIQLEMCVHDNNQKTQPCLNGARLGPKIVSHKGLVDRSTSVYHLESTNYPLGLVVKYSWQVKTHRREDTITREARQADPLHTPELFGTAVVDDPSPFETLRNACSRKSKRHEPRELRVLVIRRYRPLAELGFGDEFWDSFAQLLGCAHDLYKKKMILHHDVSMKNLAYYREDSGQPVGVLIDFDLATMPSLVQTDSTERVGTVAFMAHELLLYPHIKYGLHHDLESFFYCAIWHGLGYETSDKYPHEEGESTDILYDWRVGKYRTMAYSKVSLSPDNSVFRLMRDQEFSRKCIRLLEVFDRTMAVKRLEGYRRICLRRLKSGVVHSGEIPGSKLTYPTLMEALGSVKNACGEDCCN